MQISDLVSMNVKLSVLKTLIELVEAEGIDFDVSTDHSFFDGD